MRNGFLSEDIYKSIMENAPISTVDILFFNEDKTKTLLFKRTNEPLRGEYFSVGGRIFKNEKIIDCAVRKALEETGLEIDKNKLIKGGVQEEIFEISIYPDINNHSIDIFYGYIIPKDEKIKVDNQHTDYKWFDVNDKSLHPMIKSKLNKLLTK